MAHKVGIDCKAYRNSANTNTWNSPTWSELTNISDVTINQERGEAEIRKRGSDDVLYFSTLMSRGVEFQLIYNTGDADFEAIKDAFDDKSLIDMAFLDGNVNTNGTQGFRAEFDVISFNIAQPLEEGSTVDVMVRPSARSTQTASPTWMEVGA